MRIRQTAPHLMVGKDVLVSNSFHDYPKDISRGVDHDTKQQMPDYRKGLSAHHFPNLLSLQVGRPFWQIT